MGTPNYEKEIIKAIRGIPKESLPAVMEVVHLFKAGIVSEKELSPEVSRNELTMRTRAFEEFAGSFSKVNKKVVKFIALSPEIQYAEYM